MCLLPTKPEIVTEWNLQTITPMKKINLIHWKLEDYILTYENNAAIQVLIPCTLNLRDEDRHIKTLSSPGQRSKPLKNKFYRGVGHIYTSDVAWEGFPRAAGCPSIVSVFYRALLPTHILSMRDKTRGRRQLTLISASLSGQRLNLKEADVEWKGVAKPYCRAKTYLDRCRTCSACLRLSITNVWSRPAFASNGGCSRFNTSDIFLIRLSRMTKEENQRLIGSPTSIQFVLGMKSGRE